MEEPKIPLDKLGEIATTNYEIEKLDARVHEIEARAKELAAQGAKVNWRLYLRQAAYDRAIGKLNPKDPIQKAELERLTALRAKEIPEMFNASVVSFEGAQEERAKAARAKALMQGAKASVKNAVDQIGRTKRDN